MTAAFFGSAFGEPALIKLASGFEAVTQVRARADGPRRPGAGTTLAPVRRPVALCRTAGGRRPHHL